MLRTSISKFNFGISNIMAEFAYVNVSLVDNFYFYFLPYCQTALVTALIGSL